MPELKTRDLLGVEILDVGTWDASTGTFSMNEAQIDELVANFAATRQHIKVPAKLGHDDGQRLLQQDGYPAAGWLERLYREGTKLVSDWSHVPAKVADLMEVGGYRKTSAEIWHDVTVGTQKFGRLLMGVAFLGEDAPAVTTLDDILELYGAKAALTLGPTSKVQVVVLERAKAKTTKEAGMDRKTIRAQIGDALGKFRALIKAAAVDVSQEQKREQLQDAIDARFGNSLDGAYTWICETYDDAVIVQKGADYFRVPYIYGADGTITFDDPVPVVQTWTPKTSDPIGGTELPANTPSAEGSGVSTPATQAKAKKEADMAALTRIAMALGLADGADEAAILAKINEHGSAKTELEQVKGTVALLQTAQKQRDAADTVSTAIRAGKVAPASRNWALAYAEKDPEGFVAYVKDAPALFTAERGTAIDAPATTTATIELRDKITAARAADHTLSYKDAFDEVVRANRDLAKRAQAERQPAAATA
jgi:hypothetical protein